MGRSDVDSFFHGDDTPFEREPWTYKLEFYHPETWFGELLDRWFGTLYKVRVTSGILQYGPEGAFFTRRGARRASLLGQKVCDKLNRQEGLDRGFEEAQLSAIEDWDREFKRTKSGLPSSVQRGIELG